MNFKIWLLLVVGLVIIYFPAFSTFYTNDDFFHLRIAEASSSRDFFNFFNPLHSEDGFYLYRPLTTQAFYFLTRTFFYFNPVPLHLLTFGVFLLGIYFTYKLTFLLTNNKRAALVTVFMYAFSAIHFGHMYFLGTFQEIGLYLCVIMTSYMFTNFLIARSDKAYLWSISLFIFSLMTKETAVVVPGLLVLIWGYLRSRKHSILTFRDLSGRLIPFFVILFCYLIVHFFYYGVPHGDSYITNFSVKKTLNSLFWYILWSLGMPEMFVDFVGSGFQINPNLFKFWGQETFGIGITFLVMITLFVVILYKAFQFEKNKVLFLKLGFFCGAWFLAGLMPIIFFPFHKFTYNLTVPVFGFLLFISYILTLKRGNQFFLYMFILVFIGLNIQTISLSKKTHWITRGSEISEGVYDYFSQNEKNLLGKRIIFYDHPDDSDLPWSPTALLKGVLSDQNFFEVFYPGRFGIVYAATDTSFEGEYVRSRLFLGY